MKARPASPVATLPHISSPWLWLRALQDGSGRAQGLDGCVCVGGRCSPSLESALPLGGLVLLRKGSPGQSEGGEGLCSPLSGVLGWRKLLPTQWNHKRCQRHFWPQSAPHPRHWGSRGPGPGQQRGKGEWGATVWPRSGAERELGLRRLGRHSGFCLRPSSWEPQDPLPQPLRPQTWSPPPHTLRLEGRLPVGRTRSPRPTWQPAAWAGPQQNQTHRGPHRRGVAADWRRAAHSDQGHGAKPGTPGLARARSPPTATRTVPAPQDQEGKTEPGTSSGAALKGPYTRPARPAEPALSGRAPLPSCLPGFCPLRPRPTNTLGAESGAGRRCRVWRSAGKGAGRSGSFLLVSGVRSLRPGSAPDPALLAPPSSVT